MRIFRLLFISILLFSGSISSAQSTYKSNISTPSNALLSNGELIGYLNEAIKHDSLNTAYWLALGNAWEMQLNFDSAKYAYQNAVLTDSSCVKCLQQLAGVNATLGDVNSAIYSYYEALTIDSLSIPTRSQLARLLKRDGRFEQALAQFKNLLQTDSTNYYIWEQIGDCAAKTDSIALAIEAYSNSFELKPQNLPLAVKLINGLIQIAMPTGYIQPIAEAAYEYDSTYVPIVRANGYLHYLSQNYAKADLWFDKTTALGDSSRFTLKFSGLAKYQTGNYYGASQILKKAFALDSTDNALNFVYAKTLIEIGNRQKAIAVLNLAEELLTPSPFEMAMLYATRADAHNRSRNYQKAIEQYNQAYTFDPNHHYYIYQVGICYYNAKEYKKTIEILGKFLDLANTENPPKNSTQNAVSHAKYIIERAEKEAFFIE